MQMRPAEAIQWLQGDAVLQRNYQRKMHDEKKKR